MSVTITDLFAGAGGSSTGATQAGAHVAIAANHWRLAVDVHQDNHPTTDHDCADISQVEPRRYPTTDILWASPECTWHSNASGRKRQGDTCALWGDTNPAGERSRATMWDVPRFAEAHRYPVVFVENVVEATKWEPFRAWLMAMDSLGYRHEIISHNSMHAQTEGLPAPQSRDRLYVAFTRRELGTVDWTQVQTPQAWCPTCEAVGDAAKAWKRPGNRIGKYRSQYVYVHPACGTTVEPGWLPAASAIDWTLPAERIGDRKKPLSPKTMARISEGIKRFGSIPSVIDSMHGTSQVRPVSHPMPTQTTAWTRSLLVPYYGASDSAYPVTNPIGTLTTVDRYGLTTIDAPPAPVEDGRFRMLEPHEYAAGMAFPDTYIWRGTKRDRVKLAGNAVTPPAARDLIAHAVHILEEAA